MADRNTDGLTIKKLKTKDAADFVRIAHSDGVYCYLNFFAVRSVSEAEKVIQECNSCGSTMYGLFAKRKGLVSVFYVSPTSEGDAEIIYFTGEAYQGKGYAAKGVQMLAQHLKGTLNTFHFAIRAKNSPSISVQQKLGSVEYNLGSPGYRYFRFCF